MDWVVLALFILLILLLYTINKAADFIDDSFSFYSKRIKISQFLIGFIFLGTISSLPEITIAINSSKEIPELSAGNLLGATLILMSVVMGISVIKFKNVHFQGKFTEKEVITALGLLLVMLIAVADKSISILESLILLGLYLIYIVFLYYQFHKKLANYPEVMINASNAKIFMVKSIVGIILILITASAIVDTVIEIGDRININEALLGLFVLSFGTNLPEIVFLTKAKNLDQEKLALGNFMGSAVANVGIMGLLGLSSGGFVFNHFISIIPVLVILTLTIVLFAIFSFTGRRLSVWEGYILLASYASFIITELSIVILNVD